VTPQVIADAAGRYRREQASALKRHGIGRPMARTAGYDVVSAAGPGKHNHRTRPGPEMPVALMIGGMGSAVSRITAIVAALRSSYLDAK
jgi:crotonobetainyl-CoA:carnitine CoA-transferase CaiB-like acyl-CoA transferase